ncbi:MAG: FixH family protein [Pseudomonadota bacterium]
MSERKSAWIPWVFVGFFAVVLVVNATMIYAAVTTFGGLDRPKAFARGIGYNDVLAAKRVQDELGWAVTVSHEPVDGASGRLRVDLVDGDASPLGGADVRAMLERPTNAAMDFDTWLVAAGDGSYLAELDWPAVGVWDVVVFVRRGEDRFQTQERIVVR